MDLQIALDHRAQVEQFRHKYRTGLVTLLFTDIVGSTKLKQALGDRDAVALMHHHHALVREILRQFPDGQEISTAGDSFFLVFIKPSDAVRFALLLQSRLRGLNQGSSHPVLDRIGIHIGEVVIEEREGAAKPRDLYGMQVDSCARVMSLAAGNQILLTRSAFDNARQALKGEEMAGLGALSWLNHGTYQLAGVEEPVEICEVGEASLAALQQPADSEKARRAVVGDQETVLGWRPAAGQLVPNTKWVLEQKLGEGGFGEVWLGRHQTMKERRVFKFCFRADRVRSLKREMTLFRILKERVGDHPNIVRLLEVYFDEPPFYVVMDHVEGQDLKVWCEQQGGVEKVPLATRLEIVAQIADALQAAHDAGVIHRDVKPGNILIAAIPSVAAPVKARSNLAPITTVALSDESQPAPSQAQLPVQVKLTDFGIGQIVSAEALAGVTNAGFTQTIVAESSSSQTGSQMYMAPELLAGKPASTRSDIYSLGVVLYQLLAGDLTHPLTTDWGKRITDPLLREDLVKCFAGDPQERFAEAGQLARNLRALGQRRADLAKRERAAARGRLVRRTTVAFALVAAVLLLALYAFKQGGERGREAPPPKLAVLPLVNLSGEVAQEYFADEMTDDLIAKLGQISALRVIGRATVMQYKNTSNSVPEIARQLNVDAVVQGTLRRKPDKVQMAVRLFQGATDRLLWSTNCERDLHDVFALQNDVALAIASKMKVKLHPEEQARLTNAPLVNPEALDLYYRGNAILDTSDTTNLEAIRLYKRAVEISKDFAPAWAALAGAYIQRFYVYEPEPEKRWAGDAREAVDAAIRLDPNLAAAWVQYGRLLWTPGKNFQHEESLKLFYRALQSNPSSVSALYRIGWVYNHTGFFDEAITKAKEAAALDPLGTSLSSGRACSHLWKGEYAQSLLFWPPPDRDALPSLCGSHWAWALFALGRTNEAKAKLEEYFKQSPDDLSGELTAMNAVLLAAEGKEAESIAQIKIAEKRTEVSFGHTHHATYLIACAYARLNKTPEALKWLEITAKTGFPCYPLFRDDPNLKSLHTDAGFIAFRQKQETDWRKRKADWAKYEDGGKVNQ